MAKSPELPAGKSGGESSLERPRTSEGTSFREEEDEARLIGTGINGTDGSGASSPATAFRMRIASSSSSGALDLRRLPDRVSGVSLSSSSVFASVVGAGVEEGVVVVVVVPAAWRKQMLSSVWSRLSACISSESLCIAEPNRAHFTPFGSGFCRRMNSKTGILHPSIKASTVPAAHCVAFRGS